VLGGLAANRSKEQGFLYELVPCSPVQIGISFSLVRSVQVLSLLCIHLFLTGNGKWVVLLRIRSAFCLKFR